MLHARFTCGALTRRRSSTHIAGRKVGKRALSEPGSGRDMIGMKLRAEKDGGANRKLPALTGFSCPSQGCALCTRS